MPTAFKQSLPADSVAITVTGLASLGSSASFVAGYALAAITNRSNLDITHLLSMKVKMGTTPTVNTQVQVWMIPAQSFSGTTPVWPAPFSASYTGAAGAFTANSAGALQGVGRLVKALNVDVTTTGAVFELVEEDLAAYNGGTLPHDYFLFVTHNCGAALDATGGSFSASYTRVQFQGV